MNTEFVETASAVEKVAVGAAETAAEVASDPVRAARKQAKSFERKGTPTARRINRQINRRITAMLPERVAIFGVAVNGMLPEKLAVKGLHLVKVQARRQDMAGDVAKRTLSVFHGSFRTIARVATRLEQASEIAPRAEAARKPATIPATRGRSARRRAA